MFFNVVTVISEMFKVCDIIFKEREKEKEGGKERKRQTDNSELLIYRIAIGFVGSNHEVAKKNKHDFPIPHPFIPFTAS